MNRRYRGNVVLVELIIVILFFALSQVVVLQVFASAQQKTARNSAVSTAVLGMQDTLECLDAQSDADETLLALGFEKSESGYQKALEHGVVLSAAITRLTQPAGTLTQVTLTATRGEEQLFSFPSSQYRPLAEVTP